MEITAIKVKQPLAEFYIAKIKASDLLKVSTSAVARYNKNGELEGNQRPLKPERLKAISKFIQSSEMSFPTSIIVAANIDENGKILEENNPLRWNITPTDSDTFLINIPDGGISSLIIDGQHRLNAFKEIDFKYSDEIELVCSIFFDLPNPYQAYLFATINGNQKRVDKSLALELFGFNVENEAQDTWSPEKLAVFLTRKFNFKEGSPLYGRIKLASITEELNINKDDLLLSTAAMVDGILTLISSNPQRDRDLLAIKKKNLFGDKSRKILTNQKDNSVLRELYLNCQDNELYEILKSYFTSVKTKLWDVAKENSIIVKTIGISALFDVLKTILQKDTSIRDFNKYIDKITNVDYTNNYFSLSGKGKSRLKRILKYKMELISKEDLQENDDKYCF